MYHIAQLGMKLALKEAKKGLNKNCIPIGAVIMINNQVIAKAHNGKKHNKLAHAEILCINQAIKKLIKIKKNHDFNIKSNIDEKKDEKNDIYDLRNAIIFCTIEPCAMCMHAIKLARIRLVIFGAANKNEPLPDIQIIDGIYEKQAIELMQEFFNKQRIT